MADLVTRLLLNNTQFDNSIRESSQLIRDFQQMGRNVADTVIKFAGALGLATTASQAFERVISASQDSLDEFKSMQASITSLQNSFWAAVNAGKPTQFLSNISAITAAARNAYREISRLKNVNIFGDSEIAKIHSELEKLSMRVDNTDLSEAERKAASKEKENLLKRERDLINKKAIQYQNTYIASIRKSMAEQGITDLSDDELVKMFGTLESFDKQIKYYKDLKKLVDAGITVENKQDSRGGFYTNTSQTEESKAIEESREYKIAKAISKVKREDLELSKSYEAASYLAWEDFYTKQHEDQNERLGLYNEFKNGGGSSGSATSPKSIPAEKAVPTSMIPVKFAIPETTLKELEDKRAAIVKQMNNANQEDYVKLKVKLDETDLDIQDFKDGKYGKPKGLSATPVEIKPAITTSKTDDYSDSIEGLNALATSLQTVSNLTNEGAAAWLTYGANILTTVAAAIPAITALTAAKDMETNANVKNAATGAAASLASIPFVGPILAVAAVASVLAALMAIPKFATGGIVGGNKPFGDMNLARVNSGEMILNNHQQRNLFNLLNNGGSASNGGKVEFKIQGRELVGVLKNYNNKISKVQ